MDDGFYLDEVLSIPEYLKIINDASRRITIWRMCLLDRDLIHRKIQREINLIRHCRRLITQIQEQLN